MGLDMYLYKVKRQQGKTFADILELDRKFENEELNQAEADKLLPYLFERSIGDYKYKTLFDEVGYWRKANNIHNWFVENIQNGIDECDYYVVQKDDIIQLLDTVNKVIDSLKGKKTISKVITNGESSFSIKVYEDADLEVAKDLLPTQEGFFFGTTHYTDYYFENLKETKKILTKIVNNFSFDKNYLIYHSSW